MGAAVAPHNGGAKLLGGPSSGPLILAHLGGPDMLPYPPASRVSFSALLCELAQANPRGGHGLSLGEAFDRATLPPLAPSHSGEVSNPQRHHGQEEGGTGS